jgi:hypothetical protein
MIAVDADGDPRQIVGFYAVIPHEFRGEELPDPFRKATRAGSLSAVPGALLAQLAVNLVLATRKQAAKKPDLFTWGKVSLGVAGVRAGPDCSNKAASCASIDARCSSMS